MSEVERLEKESHAVSVRVYLHRSADQDSRSISAHVTGLYVCVGSFDGTED